ncbi:hypothetical protein Tco_0748875 [Tanacetum coccineum]|uniref:Uncharacterized protein n=1 Tax=Tanacetum coccineum TaxID=301880 RepID=A0ABQ4YWU9_9ASTR
MDGSSDRSPDSHNGVQVGTRVVAELVLLPPPPTSSPQSSSSHHLPEGSSPPPHPSSSSLSSQVGEAAAGSGCSSARSISILLWHVTNLISLLS